MHKAVQKTMISTIAIIKMTPARTTKVISVGFGPDSCPRFMLGIAVSEPTNESVNEKYIIYN